MLPALVRKPYFGIVMRWLIFLWVFTMGMLWLSTVPRTGSPWSPEYRQQLVMCTAGLVPCLFAHRAPVYSSTLAAFFYLSSHEFPSA